MNIPGLVPIGGGRLKKLFWRTSPEPGMGGNGSAPGRPGIDGTIPSPESPAADAALA
jgi:hypothetical protein